MDVVVLAIRILRAEAPSALLARLGRLGGPLTIFVLVNRLQPGCTAVVCRERHTLAEVRLEQRPRHLSRGWIEQDGRPGAVIPLGRPRIFGILRSTFPFTARDIPIPLPVPHR